MSDTTTLTKNESLPELPNTEYRGGNDVYGKQFMLYTADQMRAYAEAALTREAPTEGVDVEAMLVACVPAGSSVDPQTVADNIREWFATPPAQQRQPLSERLYRGAPHPDAHRERMMEGASVEEPQLHPDALEDGSLSKSTAKRVDALRMAQGECRHSLWSPAGGYCLDCGYSPVGPDEESAIDAAVGLAKVVLRLPVDLLGEIDHRAQQSGYVRNAYLRQLLAEHHTQPPHQDRGEDAKRWIEGAKRPLKLDRIGLDSALRIAYEAGHAAALTEAKQQGPGELADLHDTLRRIYQRMPMLPITGDTIDAATDTLHELCLCIGVHKIEVDWPAAPQVEAKRQTGGDA